jgi:hypothetical protein
LKSIYELNKAILNSRIYRNIFWPGISITILHVTMAKWWSQNCLSLLFTVELFFGVFGVVSIHFIWNIKSFWDHVSPASQKVNRTIIFSTRKKNCTKQFVKRIEVFYPRWISFVKVSTLVSDDHLVRMSSLLVFTPSSFELRLLKSQHDISFSWARLNSIGKQNNLNATRQYEFISLL